MPFHTRVLLHKDGPALWPAHKSNEEVDALQASTLEDVWETTWQGNPTPPAGSVFRRSWFAGPLTRYDATDEKLARLAVARYLSLDTGLTDKETSAYTALTVGELLPDYRLLIRRVVREQLQFPDLIQFINTWATHYAQDGKLKKIIIEAKVSGISAFQTLKLQAPRWLANALYAFEPNMGDKLQRAKQASAWCKTECITLPFPGNSATWLFDFEDELFTFPNSKNKDQVDSFSQLVIYLENLLKHGYELRAKHLARAQS